MKLQFIGAARSVTGSCHFLEINGKKILIDFGLQQGHDEIDNHALDFAPNAIDIVIVTHAHIDHSGRLPLLVKLGFQGKIVATRLTRDLLSIMLRDSAHIQESDALWASQKSKRSGKPAVEPLYTVADAEKTIGLIEVCEYGEKVTLSEGVTARFNDAGHLLGSASVELWLTEQGETRKIVFSGDIGNLHQPIIRDPQPIEGGADYVVMESTYGDRNHEVHVDYTRDLAAIIDKTFARGGNVIIPSFAVGRTQELLYFMREMKEQKLVKSAPDFTVVVDSPLARSATQVFSGNLRGYLDEDALELMKDGEALFTFPNLRLIEDINESKELNSDNSSKVIISASGMCDAGRIRHHLKHNLWRPECSVVFVGFQAEGTLGRRLIEGADTVKLLGEELKVKAEIINFKGLSSHADRDHLIAWAKQFDPKPKHIFVVHGEASVTQLFSETLKELGIDAHAPEYKEIFDLAAGLMTAQGVPAPQKQAAAQSQSMSPAYLRLAEVGKRLAEAISMSRGRANKDLARFTDQLASLLDKWEH